VAIHNEKSVIVKKPDSEFGTWFLGWLVVVALHVGMAYAIARLEGASLARSGMGSNVMGGSL
jgi:hypothetical protein